MILVVVWSFHPTASGTWDYLQFEYPDGGRFIGQIDDVRVYSNILDQQMAVDLYNGGLSDHGLTVEPFEYEPVQDPELQESVSVQVKFKRYMVI